MGRQQAVRTEGELATMRPVGIIGLIRSDLWTFLWIVEEEENLESAQKVHSRQVTYFACERVQMDS